MRHALALLAILASACAAPTAASPSPSFPTPDDARALIAKCSVNAPITAYFLLPSGPDFWDVFPNAGLAPELDRASEIFVVVYEGEADLMSAANQRDVVCVVMPDGYANVYSDVPREGMQLPPGAHLGPPG